MAIKLIQEKELFAITESAFENLRALDEKPNMEAVSKISAMDDDDWGEYYMERYGYELTPDGVAVIHIEGELFRYENWYTFMGGGCSFDGLSYSFLAALNDARVQSILFYINSPGGSVDGTGEFAEMVAASPKPTSSYVSAICASAAYWIAAAAGPITAYETALIGSIGVIATMYKLNGLLEQQGIKEFIFKSSVSPYKNPDPGIPAESDRIQALIDDLGNLFVEKVATYRGVAVTDVLQNYGQGDVMVSKKAWAAKMIDAVANFPIAVRNAIGIPDESQPNAKSNITKIKGAAMKPKAEDTTQPTDEETPAAEDTTQPTDEETPASEDGAMPTDETTDDGACNQPTSEDGGNTEDEQQIKKAAASNPKLVSYAQAKERERQKAIDGILKSFPGQKALVQELRYESQLSAGDISMKVMEADRKGKTEYLENVNADGKAVHDARIPSGGNPAKPEAQFQASLKSKLESMRKVKK